MKRALHFAPKLNSKGESFTRRIQVHSLLRRINKQKQQQQQQHQRRQKTLLNHKRATSN